MNTVHIGNRILGKGHPSYLIAEVGSNFDGDLDRAKMLIDLAKECGADAVKFQCFSTSKIVSQQGFEGLRTGFQSKWDKPVVEVYKSAEFPREWHHELYQYATEKGIDFLSTPYDKAAVDELDQLGIKAFKIGSGDVTWLEMIKYIASKGKPVILATGASKLDEVDEAVRTIRSTGNEQIILLQCVTNYPSTFESANIRAMKAMGKMFDVQVGYSDHTHGHVVPVGSIALGGCLIEKHFTDDKTRNGPDHHFAMDSKEFKEMVQGIRTLEKALGSPLKNLCPEEKDTVIVQRRCLRAAVDIIQGTIITGEMVKVLRPATKGALYPKYKKVLIGRPARVDIKTGEAFTWENI